MTSKIGWNILRHLRRVWVRVVFFALLAILTAMVAQIIAPFIPTGWSLSIGAEAVDQVLNILASSMLAVTTFSLAIATSAFSAAAQTATPRATALLQEDPTAQNVLATFLGAFLFSLVGIIALQAGYYTDNGRMVLFVMTGIVVAAVVLALLRWISHLMIFGRMADTLARVEARATASLEQWMEAPYLGGRPMQTDIPTSCTPVFPEVIGYVQHIDMGALDRLAEMHRIKIWLSGLPGTFVHPARPVLFTDRGLSDHDVLAQVRETVTIGVERDFDQDPRFGLIVISEVASRALSPAVNDPGTAISVIGRLVRIMSHWREVSDAKISYPHILVPQIAASDLMDDAFRPILRDGAGIFEVQIRLQKACEALAEIAPVFAEASAKLTQDADGAARAHLPERDLKRLR